MCEDEHSAQNHKAEFIIENNVLVGKKLQIEENSNFNQTILHTLQEYPDIVGLINPENEEKVTFAEMKDRSVRCALWLRKQGIAETDVISLSTPVQTNDYVPYLAALYVNAIVNAWDCNASTENARYYLEICRPKVIFACNQSIDKLVKIAKDKGMDCKFVAYERHEDHLSLDEIMAEQSQIEVDDFRCTVPLEPKEKVSQIIFSSGTTNTPKAILRSYRTLLICADDKSRMRHGMTCLWYASFEWISGGIFTLSAIMQRCTRIVHRRFDVEATAAIIGKYKINLIFFSPYQWMLCHQADVFSRYNFSHLETIVFTGTRINRDILENCRENIPHTFMKGVYGTTEAGGTVLRRTKNCKHLDSAGYVCSGVKLKVVDPRTGATLGPNQEGEIYFKSDIAMIGYLNNPEEAEEIMDEEGWLRSGDLGFYDEDGEVIIRDRLKAMIRTKSHYISPFELEQTLIQHVDVTDCAVIGVKFTEEEDRPFLFVIKAHDAKVTAEELIEFAASRNSCYRSIGGLAFVDELPYMLSGKKCLRTLRSMAEEYIERQNLCSSA